MPAQRLPMRQVREVLRLKHACGQSERQIAAAIGISRTTVAEYLRRAAVSGITWPVPAGLDDAALEARLFSPPFTPRDLHLSWGQLCTQLGTDARRNSKLAERVRDALHLVLEAYPQARVEATRHGLLMRRSSPSVPMAPLVNGFRLEVGGKAA